MMSKNIIIPGNYNTVATRETSPTNDSNIGCSGVGLKRVNSNKAKERYYNRRVPESIANVLIRNFDDVMISEEEHDNIL
jgi:hypothetical protein